MHHRSPRHVAALAAIFVVIACSAASVVRAQSAPVTIDIYAITNARIVTVSGAVIERGTIVIRDGLIEAIGASTVAPADARVIDGTGLTVYPGLIDSNTSLGMPAPTPTLS